MAKIEHYPYLTFDDVLIRPMYSEITSRSLVEVSHLGMAVPVLAANMDTICDFEAAIKLQDRGVNGVIHRYTPVSELDKQLDYLLENHYPTYVFYYAVGVLKNDKERIDKLIKFNSRVVIDPNNTYMRQVGICIDVAHGHHSDVIRTIKYIKSHDEIFHVIAGNVATPEGAVALAEAGADAVKVGIGPGAVCSTRTKTGVGVPQLTALMEIRSMLTLNGLNTLIIADGGFNHIGDFAKAIGAGADLCMTGSFFAGTDVVPNWREDLELIEYRGMASEEAQKEFKGKFANAEGIATQVKNKGAGSAAKFLNELKEGLQSAFSYAGARNIKEFQNKCTFLRVTNSTLKENGTRL